MQSSKPIYLPENDLQTWHTRLLTNSVKVAEQCLKICGDPDVCQDIRMLLGHRTLCHLLGGPNDGIDLKDGDGTYDHWLLQLWGRRCSYYLSSLLSGLKSASQIEHKSLDLTPIIGDLDELTTRFSLIFKRKWEVGPETSLISRGDIANYHVTYLDPILFSALYLLTLSKRGDLSLNEMATKNLWLLIKQELVKYTQEGDQLIDQIADESTVWWGLTELASRERNNFHLGRHKGWQGVVDIFCTLMRADVKIWPSSQQSAYEATQEIFGEPRTRILITKNCLDLARLVPQENKWETFRNELSGFVGKQLTIVMNENAGVCRHIYLLGIGLNLSSSALQCFSKNSEPNLESKRTNDIKTTKSQENDWVEVMRGLGNHEGSLDGFWLRLPSKFCQRLGDNRINREKWLIFLGDANHLIAFPKCLWEQFWPVYSSKKQIAPEKIKSLQECCDTITYKIQKDKKAEGVYTNKYWVIPKPVIKDFKMPSGQPQNSKGYFSCQISHADLWLDIFPSPVQRPGS